MFVSVALRGGCGKHMAVDKWTGRGTTAVNGGSGRWEGMRVSLGSETNMPIREVLVTQSCLTLCNPMDCSLPDSSVHGIFQARIL